MLQPGSCPSVFGSPIKLRSTSEIPMGGPGSLGDCLRNGSVKCRFPNLRVVEAGPVSSSRFKKTRVKQHQYLDLFLVPSVSDGWFPKMFFWDTSATSRKNLAWMSQEVSNYMVRISGL